MFCCSGVFVYQYIKYQEANKRAVTATAKAKDGEAGSVLQRSKADVLQDMKRMTAELNELDQHIKK